MAEGIMFSSCLPLHLLVLFLPCLFVGLFVCRIIQKLLNGLQENWVSAWGMGQGCDFFVTNAQLLMKKKLVC